MIDEKNNDFHRVDYQGCELVLGTIQNPLLDPGDIDEQFQCDLLIFASRHRSESGEPSILVHPTGNWKDAEYGGLPGRVSRTSGILIQKAYQAIKEKIKTFDLKHRASMEVTHHGPTECETPFFFIELGSTEREWTQEHPARFVAEVILEVARFAAGWSPEQNFDGHWIPPEGFQVGIGFGGTHYTPLFNKLVNRTNYATAHIVPKYFIRDLTREQIQHIIDRTMEHISFFVIDWKGMNAADKNHLLPILESFEPEIPTLRVRKLLK